MLKRVVTTWSIFLLIGFYSLQSQALKSGLPDFTELIEKNSPAVVKIEVVGKAAIQQQVPPGMPDIFRRFFDQQRGQQKAPRSMGSGFIISDDGYVLTNNHVIDQADEILVRLNDREEFTAVVIGTDASTDLALLKIDGDNLPTVQLGDSESLKVGEWVVAIGSPFGLDYSASVGIVSAIGRSIPTEQGEDFVPFIQTDVAINPGNSGGPLFNLEGEVVGINSQIYTRSGGSNGISFSIPAHLAKQVVEQLKENGEVKRGWFGITMQKMDKDLAESLGLEKNQGALVSEVQEDGPAAEGDVKAGDVIVEIDGHKISTINDLSHVVGITKPGTNVDIIVVRDGEKQTLSVEIGTRGGNDEFAFSGGADRLGLNVVDLDEKLMSQLRMGSGVVIEVVEADSAAAKAGLRAGDVIVRLGNYQVSDITSYGTLVEKIPQGQPVTVRFYRQGRAVFTTIVVD